MSDSSVGGVRRFDHVGLVVDELELMTAPFAAVGFERGNPMRLVETCGPTGAKGPAV
jgi:hypothetical protein